MSAEEKKPEVTAKVSVVRRFNLGGFNNFQEFSFSIEGNLEELQEYDSIEPLLKSIAKKMSLSFSTIRKYVKDKTGEKIGDDGAINE